MDELTQTTATANSAFTIANALKDKVYVESVTETADGYVIKFTNGKTATIANGEDGQDATAPTIGVTDGEGGALYWTVNGEVMKDASGNPVNASVAIPEFKFDNNKWWYRFGAEDTWKDCGEKTGPEPSITETDEFVIITIGDKSISIPKEVVAPGVAEIKVNLVPRKNIFVPIGESVDLKDFFEVEPEGALKLSVNYEYTEGAYTVDSKGILTATGNTVAVAESNNVPVTITSKANPEVSATINVRICAAPNNEEIECTCEIPEANRIYMFKEGLEDFNALASLGGAGNYNAINECLGGLMGAGGLANMYFTTQPFGGITLANGHLHFEYYLSSLEKLDANGGQVELSSRSADQEERNWPTAFLKDAKVGWNEVDLALKESGETYSDGTPFNPEAIKWFRMYIPTSAVHEEAIMVKNVFVYEAAPDVSAINVNLVPRKNIFVPIGESVDLKDFFEVEPEGALKLSVNYEYTEGAYTVDSKGILTATGNTVAVAESNNVPVTITSKANPEVSATINVRICAAPNNEEIECTCEIPEANRIYMFKEGLEDFNALASLGGAGNYNAINECLGGLMGAGGLANMYFTTQPFGGITLANGHLHFEYYLSSLEKLDANGGQVELSSRSADQEERNWPTAFLKDAKVGWNEVDLALKESGETYSDGTPFNPEAIKWFRMYIPTSAVHEEAIMVKNVFVYAEPEPVKITIDGDMSEWAKVKGVSEGNYSSFKVASDENNIYFYSFRAATTARYADIWGGAGYVYLGLDFDNDDTTGTAELWGNGPYDFVGVIYPYGGSASEPAVTEAVAGGSTSVPEPGFKNAVCKGVVNSDGVAIEVSIPRSALPAIPETAITVKSWGNKDLHKVALKVKL